jgi:hypothetical protein
MNEMADPFDGRANDLIGARTCVVFLPRFGRVRWERAIGRAIRRSDVSHHLHFVFPTSYVLSPASAMASAASCEVPDTAELQEDFADRRWTRMFHIVAREMAEHRRSWSWTDPAEIAHAQLRVDSVLGWYRQPLVALRLLRGSRAWLCCAYAPTRRDAQSWL